MKCCFFTLAVLLSTTLHAADEDKSKRSDPELIQGTWQVVALEAGGNKASEESYRAKRFLIEGDKISTSGKPADLRPYQLNMNASPRAIDLPGSIEGEFAKAIYEVEGDNLKLCFSQSTTLDRPRDFETAGTRYFCFTLKRVEDVEGTWERHVKDDEGKPHRIVKQHLAGKTTLTVYDGAGKVVHQHQSSYKLQESGGVRLFVFFKMEATAGPAKGQEQPDEQSYAYRIDGESFYEFRGVVQTDDTPPTIVVWQRVNEQ